MEDDNDEKAIKKAQKINSVNELRRLLFNRQNQKNFKIGDVLVCKNIANNSYIRCGTTMRKWVVCHVDEHKLIYAKRILSNGKISNKVKCLTVDYLSNIYIYDIDPEHVEHVLLDSEDEYSPTKNIRETNRLKNKVRNY